MAQPALIGDPVSARDRLDSDVADELARLYGVGNWLACRRTPKGSSNTSWFVTTTEGRFVLRRSNDRKTIASLEAELRLIEHLRGAGYPAPEVRPTVDGGRFAVIDSNLYLLTAFIDGEPCDPDNAAHRVAAAAGLARYHQLVRPVPDILGSGGGDPAARFDRSAISAVRAAEAIVRRSLPRYDAVRLSEVLASVVRAILQVDADLRVLYGRLDRIVIQGSYGRSALIFRGSELAGVVDYDRAAYDLLGLDLAYTVKAFCRVADPAAPGHGVALDLDRCREFMAAYRSVAPLPDRESDGLPLLLRAQRLLKVVNKCRNYRRKNELVPQEEKDARKVVTMIEREAIRLEWLEQNDAELRRALGGQGR